MIFITGGIILLLGVTRFIKRIQDRKRLKNNIIKKHK